ncbi:MAG: molecular chaperone TorD family protein [Phycisphaeraceae bacterium]|nr:molecular chaperone TorD family protein [Phycisphaeraceae bacterium]
MRRVLGHVVSRDCPPCETEYLPSHDAATRAQHMADLGGFYRAFGVWPDGSQPRRPDHVQFIVGFVGLLLTKLCDSRTSDAEHTASEHTEVCADALRKFLNDHAVWWLPTFARRAEERALAATRHAHGEEAETLAVLGRVAGSLRRWTAIERSATGIMPSRRIVQPMIGGAASDEPDCNDCGTCSVSEG